MARNVFQERNVVITGASSGIGAALARRFAGEGARLALVARREDRLRTLADEIAVGGRPKPAVIVADLLVDDAPQKVVAQAREALGQIDVLVNNAGLGYAGPFAEHSAEQTQEMLRLNIRAPVRLAALVLPEMLERRCGWIMNVASTAAYQPMPYLATYAATKAFVLSWSEALWAEVRKRGVVVTAVNPGTTRTEFFDDHTWNKARAMVMKQAMSAERVADIGVRALARGQPSVVCGWSNRLSALATKLMPRSWTTRIIARMLKP